VHYLRTLSTVKIIQQKGKTNEYGKIGEMILRGKTKAVRQKRIAVPLSPPQVAHALASD
jgi:hypothetical protein